MSQHRHAAQPVAAGILDGEPHFAPVAARRPRCAVASGGATGYRGRQQKAAGAGHAPPPGGPDDETQPQRRSADNVQEYLLRLAVSRSEAAAAIEHGALALIDDAEDRAILAARLDRTDAEWADDLPASTHERIADLRRSADALPPLTREEARAAAQEACERLAARRTRESLRLQTQNIARIEQELDRTAVAEAAAAYNAGDADELTEELSEAAARVIQARDDALSLHHPQRPAARRDDEQELARPATQGSRQ